MKTVVGVFLSRAEAERAAESLRQAGIQDNNISLLHPGSSVEKLEAVPVVAGEQPGMGQAMGGVVGAGIGVAGSATVGLAIATSILPGVGPVIAVGIIASALVGAALGAVGGAAAGKALEESLITGLPIDELYVYEDALRKGRSVVICFAQDDEQARVVRDTLTRHHSETIDAAEEAWWIGLRDVEEERYVADGGDFRSGELPYRRGFEAAQRLSVRGKTYDQARDDLRQRYPDTYAQEPFRRGYLRGKQYRETLGSSKE